MFIWVPKGWRLGKAIWLGAVALSVETADADTIIHEVCHVAQRMAKKGHAREACARACARLGAAVCNEFRRLGIGVRPSNEPPTDLQQFDDVWNLCRRNQLLSLFPGDPEFEIGDALD